MNFSVQRKRGLSDMSFAFTTEIIVLIVVVQMTEMDPFMTFFALNLKGRLSPESKAFAALYTFL